jgi:predicted RNase H-like nuclease (RuvC/YqgF family)
MASNNYPKQKGGVTSDTLVEKIREVDFRSNFEGKEEKNNLEKKLERLQQNKYQEQIIFNQKNQETQSQIKNLQTEIKGLASSVKNLDKEIDKAVENMPQQAGVYHLNFLEKLKEAIVLLRKRVDEASTWLELFNQKSSKKHGYWAGVKKGGSKFLLSVDRQVATSVG